VAQGIVQPPVPNTHTHTHTHTHTMYKESKNMEENIQNSKTLDKSGRILAFF
jgi:hypothetical protein